MNRSLWCLFILLLAGCAKHDSKKFVTGETLSGDGNANAVTTLNYKINRNAINQQSLLLLVKKMKQISVQSIPEAWPLLNFELATASLRFMVNEDVGSISDLSYRKKNEVCSFRFFSKGQNVFNLKINQDVKKLSWLNQQGLAVKLLQQSQKNWSIDVDSEQLLLDLENMQLCYLRSCIDV